MNKAQLIDIVQKKLGAGTSKRAAADALDAVIQAVTPSVRKRAAPRRRTASPAQPMSLPQALKRDVVSQTQVPVIQGTKLRGLMRNTKTLKEFKEQIQWK